MNREFEIQCDGPLRLDLTAWALRRRPHNEIDRFDGESFRRVLVLSGGAVDVSVRQIGTSDDPRLRVEVTTERNELDDDQLTECAGILEVTLGLRADLSGFYRLAANDANLATLATRFRGVRPPRFPSVFEAVVNAAACQQLSLTVGIHLLNRLAARFGATATALGDAPHAFPTPNQLADADPWALRDMGFSMAKARTIIELAAKVATNELDVEALTQATDEGATATLLSLHGIGRWSAESTL
ncbi:MAG: DNA-3-methyladenine glycosylase 2 family protein, partial [Acidimicrobiales bacterium]